jgi:hypothetical protein
MDRGSGTESKLNGTQIHPHWQDQNGTRIHADLTSRRDADPRGSDIKTGTRILADLTIKNGTRIHADLTIKTGRGFTRI